MAHHVDLMLQTYEEAARQAAVSRLYGGIHIKVDNTDGLKLGTAVGANVDAALSRLSPSNFLPKREQATWLSRLQNTYGSSRNTIGMKPQGAKNGA